MVGRGIMAQRGIMVRRGIVVWRGTARAAELRPDTLGVATPSVRLQFGRASIPVDQCFFMFFSTVINMFVT